VITTANWGGLAAGKALISRIHAGAKGAPKPLVVGLQEGGPYRAYTDLPPAERELDIGDAGSASGAQAWATGWATALRSAGFDLDLSIIGDVATLDSPIADRAFSDETEVASTMTAAAVTGCTGAKLACAVAHFPGAGAESQDTDEGPATVSETTPELEQRDLGPFRAAISAGAPAIVLSNAFYAAYDPVTPASLTSEIATTLLREQLRYQGLAITDDLSSGAIRGGEGAAESAVRALAAGADMVYVSDPADAAAARTALLKAVQADAIPQERIDDAVGRVLELKRRQGLLPKG
jgi:beta-N-acetylhexosaminidase